MAREYNVAEKNMAAMLIKFYNMQAGTAFRTGNEANMIMALEALDRVGGDVVFVKDFIREWTKTHDKGSLVECFEHITKPVEAEVKPVEEPKPVASTEQAVGSALDLISKTVANIVATTQAEQIKSEIMGQVEGAVRAFIKEEYGTIERKIITVVDGKKAPMQGIQHECFEDVIKYVSNDIPVFLTGPAGSGKNVLCKQVAEALGLKFYFTNAVTQEYKLTGFVDAMGSYQETQFYKAFTQGGLFMLDEMDASIPEVLVILNAAIANRYFDFPGVGFVEAHPDFRVIAAGNTFGQGASYEYVGRNQLDAASLNRFATVQVGYSEAIENSVAGDLELAQFCRMFRASALKAGQQVVVSYRNIGMIAKMMQIMDLDRVLEHCLVKGLEKDDLNIIINGIPVDSKYKRALRRIVGRM